MPASGESATVGGVTSRTLQEAPISMPLQYSLQPPAVPSYDATIAAERTSSMDPYNRYRFDGSGFWSPYASSSAWNEITGGSASMLTPAYYNQSDQGAPFSRPTFMPPVRYHHGPVPASAATRPIDSERAAIVQYQDPSVAAYSVQAPHAPQSMLPVAGVSQRRLTQVPTPVPAGIQMPHAAGPEPLVSNLYSAGDSKSRSYDGTVVWSSPPPATASAWGHGSASIPIAPDRSAKGFNGSDGLATNDRLSSYNAVAPANVHLSVPFAQPWAGIPHGQVPFPSRSTALSKPFHGLWQTILPKGSGKSQREVLPNYTAKNFESYDAARTQQWIANNADVFPPTKWTKISKTTFKAGTTIGDVCADCPKIGIIKRRQLTDDYELDATDVPCYVQDCKDSDTFLVELVTSGTLRKVTVSCRQHVGDVASRTHKSRCGWLLNCVECIGKGEGPVAFHGILRKVSKSDPHLVTSVLCNSHRESGGRPADTRLAKRLKSKALSNQGPSNHPATSSVQKSLVSQRRLANENAVSER